MRTQASFLVLGTLVLSRAARADETALDRLRTCHDVVEELAASREDVRGDLLDKARCVVVIPGVKKGAIGFGARFGWGAAVCRTGNSDGPWGAPLMVSLKRGSFGLQIGGQSTDLLLLVMGRKGM